MKTKKLLLTVLLLLIVGPFLVAGTEAGGKSSGTPNAVELGISEFQTDDSDQLGERPPQWYRKARRRHMTALMLYITGLSAILVAGLSFILF